MSASGTSFAASHFSSGVFMRVTRFALLFALLSRLACSASSSPTSPSDSASSQGRIAITAKEAVSRAGSFASGWASDAVLFAVIGVERQRPPTRAPAGMQPNDDQGGREFPCGPIDAATWEMSTLLSRACRKKPLVMGA